MKHVLYLLAVGLILMATDCKKKDIDPCPGHNDPDILPPKTQCGANTFGCLINGEVWVPEFDKYRMYEEKVHAEYGKEYFVVMGTRIIESDSVYEIVKIQLNKDISSTGVYKINEWWIDKTSGDYENFMTGLEYETKGENNGELHITKFDRENFIIAGTFWFTAVNQFGDTVKVTDGRFDVRE